MTAFFWHFCIGFMVSFLGSLPLGTVNLAVIQTTVSINFRAGFYLALGATMIELIYSAIAIKFIAFLLQNPTVEIFIQLFCVPAFIILGFVYLRKEDNVEGEEIKIVKRSQSFLNGLFIGLINPLQIPFWIAYGSYLISEHYIDNDDFLLNVFIIGICSGTIVVLTLIALLSKKIISKINIQTRLINKSIGIVLFAIAIYQIVKLTLHFVK